VEQIATMKPKALTEHEDGMLEFLEDIVGSSRFKSPIELLAKRVEHVTELRAEKVRWHLVVDSVVLCPGFFHTCSGICNL
jgi:hypothetical protein